MTVIAGFTMPGGAALIGDVLASSDGRSDSYISIPTVDDPERRLWKKLNYSAGLFRKLIEISPYLCVAWSGGQGGAIRMAEDMRRVAGEGPVPKKAFQQHMDAISRCPVTARMSMIALAVYDTGETDMLARNVRSIDGIPNGMKAFCGGGGKFDAIDLIAHRGALREIGSDEELVLGLAHKLIGTFYGRESAPGDGASGQNPLRSATRYGGGYEVAFVRDGRIVCDGDTTVLFWKGHLSARGVLKLHPPKLFVRRAYVEGHLMLRWGSVGKSWSDSIEMPYADQHCVLVPQVDEPAASNPEQVRSVSSDLYPAFSALYEASIVNLTAQNGPKYILTATQSPLEGHTRNLSFVDGSHSTQLVLNRLAVDDGLRFFLQRSLKSAAFRRVKTKLGGSER
jgi:hypothetical protein